MTIERMWELRAAILDAIEEGAEGVVITHGTDTIEETAYLLDRSLPPSSPVRHRRDAQLLRALVGRTRQPDGRGPGGGLARGARAAARWWSWTSASCRARRS
jgi:hypothetical protein